MDSDGGGDWQPVVEAQEGNFPLPLLRLFYVSGAVLSTCHALLGKSCRFSVREELVLVLQAPAGQRVPLGHPAGRQQPRDWEPGSVPQGQGPGFQGCFLGVFLSFSVRAMPGDHGLLLCPRASPEISWVNLDSISQKLRE